MRRIIALLVIVLLIGAGAYYYFADPYASRLLQARVGDFMHAAATPDEIEHAAFVLSANNGGGIYQQGKLIYDDYVADGSIVTDLALAGTSKAKTVFQPTTETSSVFVDDEQVYSSLGTIQSLAISPDAAHIAFATLSESMEGLTANWQVVVIEVATQETVTMPGLAVTFLDNETPLVIREDGAYAVMLGSGEEYEFIAEEFTSSDVLLARASDADRLVVSQASQETHYSAVYELDYIDSRWVATELNRFDSVATDVAVTHEGLYLLVRPGNLAMTVTKLIRHDILEKGSAPELIRTYPEDFSPIIIAL